MPPTHPSHTPTTIFTRATLTLATSQRLINSWLPPTTPSLSTKEEEDQEEQEKEEIFTAEPEVSVPRNPPLP
jgi:hypothetical protein